MQVIFTKPDPVLRPYVQGYYYIELDDAGVAAPLDIHPVGYNTMAFTWQSGVFSSGVGSYDFRLSYHGFISRHIRLTPLQSRIKMLVVSFTTTGASQLFGISQHELLNQIVPLEEVLPGASRIKERLESDTSGEERVGALIEQWLIGQLCDRTWYRHAVSVERACALIQSGQGDLRIRDLCRDVGISQTRLEHHFKTLVGISPKLYCRITRFMAAYQFLLHQTDVEWSELVYRYRFFDQAHFIRDFKSFFGYTPSKIHLANAKLVRELVL